MLKWYDFRPGHDMLFRAKVREMCKSCPRYGRKTTCPPAIEPVEYWEDLLQRYGHGQLVIGDYFVGDDGHIEAGRESSLAVHAAVTQRRAELFRTGHYFVVGFGAGSCKLCDRCSTPCAKPAESLVPLEATGLDVVELARGAGVEISFPVRDRFHRVGAVFFD